MVLPDRYSSVRSIVVSGACCSLLCPCAVRVAHFRLVRLAGWLNGWLIWRERKTLLVGWLVSWLADLA